MNCKNQESSHDWEVFLTMGGKCDAKIRKCIWMIEAPSIIQMHLEKTKKGTKKQQNVIKKK